MNLREQYDVAIIGGGLAGLGAAIQLARMGHSVVLFEKEKYPFHKVCGEYISLESWNFLVQLGVPLPQWKLPQITSLQLTAPNGVALNTKLPLGGFGVSRFLLDSTLADLAMENGVLLLQQTKVTSVQFQSSFSIAFSSHHSSEKSIRARVCLGAFGKRSNLDVKWNRPFVQKKSGLLQNHVAVKYHVKANWPNRIIGLHNFENGYCGISKVENDVYCLCYITRAKNLRTCNNSIARLEKEVLSRNLHLKNIFESCVVLPGFPVTISQISFRKKSQVQNHVLLMGDAAGMITPLCGNGMSIALHTAKLAASLAHGFLTGRMSRAKMERQYRQQWKKHFARRLAVGRTLQGFFGSKWLSNLFVKLFKHSRFLTRMVVKMTHGRPF